MARSASHARPGRCALAAATVLLAALLSAGPAQACRLALALGFDVSRSVNAAAYAIQIEGIRLALRDERVRNAILQPDGRVALAIFEWAGRAEQTLVADWRVIGQAGDLDELDRLLASHNRSHAGFTALGSALDYGRRLLDRAPDCTWQTLDISGDGRSNDGPSPAEVYRRADFGDITVNGLAIGGHESDIARYYADHVIRGPGAFVEFARTHVDFPEVFLRKLLRELLEQAIGQAPAPPAGARGG